MRVTRLGLHRGWISVAAALSAVALSASLLAAAPASAQTAPPAIGSQVPAGTKLPPSGIPVLPAAPLTPGNPAALSLPAKAKPAGAKPAGPAGPLVQIAPGQPQSVSATGASVTATVTWVAPVPNGGPPIDAYLVDMYIYNPATGQPVYVGYVMACGGCLSVVATGLSTSASYTFGVYAHNQVGYGAGNASPYATLSPLGETEVGHATAAPAATAIVVSWAVPYWSAYSAPTSYTVTVYQSGNPTPVATASAASGATSITVGGLVNGQSYYATVVAQYGASAGVSATTNTVAAGAPGADALAGAGDRTSFRFDSYGLSDQVAVKVNVGSGNLEVTQGDFSLPGVTGRYLFSQVFNSLALSPAASSAGSALLSPGWRSDSSPDVRLVVGSGQVIYHDPTGGAWSFTGTGNGPFSTPAGLDATLVRNPNTSWSLTDHATNQVRLFDGAGVLVSFSARNGAALGLGGPVTFSYDNQGLGTNRITGSAGYNPANSTTITAGTDGRVHQIDLAAGDGSAARSTKFGYDANSRLQTVSDMANETTTYGYNTATGDLTSITTAGGRQITFGYDAAHRVTSVTRVNPGLTSSVTGYSYTAGQTTVVDPDAHPATVYSIDSAFRVTNTVDAKGQSSATVWAGDAKATSSTDAYSKNTVNTYGANVGPNGGESLTKVVDPDNAVLAAGYTNPAGPAQYQPSSATDTAGNITAYGYDGGSAGGPGNLTTTTNAAAAAAKVAYYLPQGLLNTSTDPINVAANNSTSYGDSPMLLPYSVTAPSGNTLGAQLVGQDIFGRTLLTEDARGAIVTYGYDSMDRLNSVGYNDATHSIANVYDSDGNLTQRTDGTGVTTYGFDALGRLTSKVAPTANLGYGYDLATNLSSVTDAGGTTGYHYDKRNQVDQVLEFSGRYSVFGYDNNGRRADTWTNTGGPVQYDQSGNNVIAPTSFATHTHATYTAAGRPAQVKTTLASSDANANRFSDLTDSYTTTGNCPGTTAGRPTSQIQTVTDNIAVTVTYAYCYNTAGRLYSAITPGGTYVYTYDADGNPLTGIGPANPNGYNSANQVTDGGYSHDANGAITATPTVAAAYNGALQTTSFTPAGQGAVNQTYAGLGQTERTGSGATSYANGKLGVESETTAGATTAYQRDPAGTLIAERTPAGGDYYYVLDGHGSVIGLVTPAGLARAAYGYDPYGGHATATALNGALPANPWRYSGQYLDPGTGLYKMGARYYDPTLGRFTQQDSIVSLGDPANGNRYAYVAADPVNRIDPSGLFSFGLSNFLGLSATETGIVGIGCAFVSVGCGVALGVTAAGLGLASAFTS